MTVNQFYIEMDHPICSYFAGQSVSGKLIVESIGGTRIKGITIVFVGKSAVHWTESHQVRDNETSRKVTQTYSADEEYFNYKIRILGYNSDGNTEEMIPNGRNAYPFQFTLPPGLPTSFNGSYGKVYYYVEAVLKISWKLDRKAMVPFTVNDIVDLNRNDRAQLPGELSKHKYICCLCCRSGPVGFTFKVGRMGYVPGENIEIIAEMFNQSTRKVLKTTLTLYQTIEYRATTKSRSEKRLLKVATGPFVDQGESESWVGRVLQIPPVPPSTLGKSLIIDVQYMLMVEMDLSGPAINLKGTIPLIIGTIPLRSTFQGFQSQAYENRVPETYLLNTDVFNKNIQPHNMHNNSVTEAGNSFNVPLPSAPVFEAYPDLPPPAYAEAIAFPNVELSKGNISGQRNMGFICNGENSTAEIYEPKYITYGWTTFDA